MGGSREKAYRFSFLTTSKAIVAYQLYLKLGYKDATEFPSTQKIIKKRKVEEEGENEKKPSVDWKKFWSYTTNSRQIKLAL